MTFLWSTTSFGSALARILFYAHQSISGNPFASIADVTSFEGGVSTMPTSAMICGEVVMWELLSGPWEEPLSVNNTKKTHIPGANKTNIAMAGIKGQGTSKIESPSRLSG